MRAFTDAIDRFCRKHPNFGIPNLMLFIVIGTALVYVMDTVSQSTFSNLLFFSRALIFHGEVWRLITFIFVPSNSGIVWLAISLYFYYFIGSALERQWGAGRFTAFYLVGTLINIIFGLITGYTENYYVNMSMFFALAALFPDLQFLLFFIIPVKAKWLAWADAALFVWEAFSRGWPYGLLPLVAIINFLLFFGEDFFAGVARLFGRSIPKRSRNTANFKKSVKNIQKEKGYLHKCAVCGITDADDPDMEFRYCSKCKGYYCYCMNHINSHIHITE